MSTTTTTKPAPDLADPAMIRRALNLFVAPGGVVEIRAVHVPCGRGKPCTVAGYFSDLDLATEAAVTLDKRRAGGIYITLNEANPALFARSPNILTDHQEPTTSDNDILRRRWFPIDTDATRPAGISATDIERRAARILAHAIRLDFASKGWPAPIVGDSGNGGHLSYRIDLPAKDGGLVERCLKALAAAYADYPMVKVDTSTHNPARVWKLYGTCPRKGHSIADRPHRPARLVEVPERIEVVPVALLEALAKKPDPPKTSTSGNGHGEPLNSRLDVDRWLIERGVGFRRKEQPDSKGRAVFVLDRCPFDSAHGGNGESVITQEVNGKLGAKCMHNSCAGRGWQEFKQKIGAPDPDHWDPPRTRQQSKGQDQGKTSAAAKPDEPIHLRRITAVELDSGDYNLEYLVEGALVKGQPCIIAGGRKSLKTSLMIDMGISLCIGGFFLGKLKVKRPVRVGILSGESGMATIQETSRRICAAAGYQLSEIVDGLVFSPDIPIFEDARHLEALRQFISTDHLEAVFVDPAFMAMSGADAGNLFVQGKVLRLVNSVCDELGATFCLVHHTKRTGKQNPNAPVELDDIAWSGFAEWARQWILIGRREPYEVGSGLHRLWLTTGGSAGHNHLWAVDVDEGPFIPGQPRKWDVTVSTPEEAREAAREASQAAKDQTKRDKLRAKIEEAKTRILEAVAKIPDGDSKTRIRDRSGVHPREFETPFGELLESGALVPCDIFPGKRKRPIVGYKLGEGEIPHA